jgi:methanogenic corrinoid protein MtbC1
VDVSERLKAEAGELPAVSAAAGAKFAESLPKLLNLVNEKFAVAGRLAGASARGEDRELTRDAHMHFGRMLKAVFEFGLYEELGEEFAWYVSTLSVRGLGESYFRKMLEGWIIAVHSTIGPPLSGELTLPLEWLRRRLHDFSSLRPAAPEALIPEGESFLNLVLERRRRDAAEYILSLKDTGFPHERLFSDVVLPALREVGRLWQTKEISVADEHAATEICRYVIFRVIDSIPRDTRLPYKAVVACVPGEEHEMAARVLADYMEARGWTVIFLGRSLPEDDLVAAVSENAADVVILSVTMIANLPALRDLLKRLREISPGAKAIVGGRAAIRAQAVLRAQADAVVPGFEEAHSVSLRLVRGNA